MSVEFDIVTIDSPQPQRLAEFWETVLGLIVIEREDGDRWTLLGDMSGARRIGIQRGPHRPGGTHLDLRCSTSEFENELQRVLSLGAGLVAPPRHEPYGLIANLVDPDGNVFDLCAYH